MLHLQPKVATYLELTDEIQLDRYLSNAKSVPCITLCNGKIYEI